MKRWMSNIIGGVAALFALSAPTWAQEPIVIGVSVPVTALVDQFYGEVQALGGGRQDTSALIRRLPKGHG